MTCGPSAPGQNCRKQNAEAMKTARNLHSLHLERKLRTKFHSTLFLKCNDGGQSHSFGKTRSILTSSSFGCFLFGLVFVSNEDSNLLFRDSRRNLYRDEVSPVGVWRNPCRAESACCEMKMSEVQVQQIIYKISKLSRGFVLRVLPVPQTSSSAIYLIKIPDPHPPILWENCSSGYLTINLDQWKWSFSGGTFLTSYMMQFWFIALYFITTATAFYRWLFVPSHVVKQSSHKKDQGNKTERRAMAFHGTKRKQNTMGK